MAEKRRDAFQRHTPVYHYSRQGMTQAVRRYRPLDTGLPGDAFYREVYFTSADAPAIQGKQEIVRLRAD